MEDQPTEVRRGRKRWLALAVVVALGVAAWLAYPRWVRNYVLDEARRRGVELTLGELELGWSELVITNAAVKPIGLEGVEARVERVTIDLERFEPQRLAVIGASVELTGSAASLAVDVGEWCAKHPSLLSLPASAENVSVRWRSEKDAEPWLSVEGAAATPRDRGAALSAERARVAGVEVGRVGAEWSGDAAKVSLGFGVADLALAPVTLEVHHAAVPPSATLELRPTPLDRLAAPLGVKLPIEGVSASGEVELRYEGGPVGGTLSAVLSGYRPPVPAELAPLVFGDESVMRSKLELSADRMKLHLSEMEVTHGALKLTGEGHVTRKPDHADILIELDGTLACRDIAAAAVKSRLGKALGGLLAEAARAAVDGSVAIGLSIEASSLDLAAAKLTRKVGLGCGLKLLRELPELPDLSEMGKDLPKLPDDFELPKGLPPLPELPKLPRPKSKP